MGLLMGCPNQDGNNNDNGTGGGGGGGTTNLADNGLVVGRVFSVDGDPLANASVTLSVDRSATTDDNGFYSFSDLDAGEVVVARFAASGFAPTSKSLTVIPGDQSTPACVFMAEAGDPVMVDADAGSTQRAGNSAVTFTGGSLVDSEGNAVNGDVELTTTFIDPSTSSVMAFPGSFDDAMRSGGSMTTLESFGFATYELSQDGEAVNLAPGQTARIEYTLPDNGQSQFSVGDTIPLWEFQDDTAMWVEAGTGEIGMASDGSGMLAWFADVEHFSAWNCDAPVEEKHNIVGRVLFEGNPISGAEISGVGEDYNGTSNVRTSADGSFCVDVKRGSSVRIEVRVNGAAVPVHTQVVSVPDSSSACPDDGVDIGDIPIDFESCVQGQVTNNDGSPAAGVRVHIVPGETVTTDADGNYCGAAPSDATVAVFVQGRPSISVQTPASASCGGSCAVANLEFSLPENGDIVGYLSAGENTSYDTINGETTTFSVNGAFIVGDTSGNPFDIGSGADVQEFGECVVTSITTDLTDIGDLTAFTAGFTALDPGNPGSATNGTAAVDLFAGDPAQANPPLPYLAGFFSPEEDSAELIALGFGANQTVAFGFEGGLDIGGFAGSVQVPEPIVVTSPDLMDADLVISNSGALAFVWVAGSGDLVYVSIGASTSSITSVQSTTISCEFPDNGSGTIPAGAMALLPDDATATSVTVLRYLTTEIDVPLNRVGGTGIVYLNGSTSMSRAIINTGGIGIPDIPDLSDLCDLITCPDGTVCNPETFMCE
jgi:hypothetical protein